MALSLLATLVIWVVLAWVVGRGRVSVGAGVVAAVLATVPFLGPLAVLGAAVVARRRAAR